jgi:hypothetical protein
VRPRDAVTNLNTDDPAGQSEAVLVRAVSTSILTTTDEPISASLALLLLQDLQGAAESFQIASIERGRPGFDSAR